MTAAIFFRNTPLVSSLRTISRGKILPHPPENVKGITESTSSDYDGEFLVTWEGNADPSNPKNFPMCLKIFIAAQIGLLTFIVTVSSSIYSGGMQGVMDDFECGTPVAALGLTTFVLGYGIGPMLWGPLSETPTVGRNLVYIPNLLIFLCLQIPTALAKNPGSLISLRFLGGFFASPVLAVGGGSVVDIFEANHIPYSMGVWGSMAALGPLIGPLTGGFAYQNHNWRWTIWAVVAMAGSLLLILTFLLPETSPDKLLREKAERFRRQSGDTRWRAACELKGQASFKDAAKVHLVRPFQLLIFDPIVLLLSVYLALIYGIEYLFFEAFPIVFSGVYGWQAGPTGLGFFGIFVGLYIGVGFHIWFIKFRYIKLWEKLGHEPPVEEWLWSMIFSAILIPISMFWVGWSARPEIHWIVPIIGSSLFGFALFIFFQGICTYLAMAYRENAASALAANDLLRCASAAAFPVFTSGMYHNLGIGWASSVPGFISLALTPIPYMFYRYGARIRKWSRYTKE